LSATEPNHADARAADAATDFVFAALAHLIDQSPQRVLVLDRAALRCEWTRRLLIELGDDWVAFSFPDNAGAVQ
jgi:hypothetical protein